MEIAHSSLPHSRLKYSAKLTSAEVDEHFEAAVKQLSTTIKVSGFRSGKAPKELVRQQLSSDIVREEASSLAVRAIWREIIPQLTETPIQDPEVMLESFDEGKAAEVSFEFDVRPKVTVGAWQKIKVKGTKSSDVSDEDVAKVINSLSQAHASTTIKLGPAAKGDKMELDFEGSVGSVRKDKLSAKNFPLIVGEGTTIPGFDDHLVGLKKGETKTFKLTFPKDHFDKELAGKEAEFNVTISEVFNVILPELGKEFAERFGHKTPEQLKKAIHKDLIRQKDEEAFVSQKAKWLAEFEPLVTVDPPPSLIQAEVERSKNSWRQFLQERHLNEGEWLKTRELTMEQLEKDWHKAAESSVKIGLGLAEVARELKKELKSNEEFQTLLDELVKKALKP